MRTVLLCRDMNWTYEEYMQQPIWFVNLINLSRNLEAEYENKQAKKSQMKNKR